MPILTRIKSMYGRLRYHATEILYQSLTCSLDVIRMVHEMGGDFDDHVVVNGQRLSPSIAVEGGGFWDAQKYLILIAHQLSSRISLHQFYKHHLRTYDPDAIALAMNAFPLSGDRFQSALDCELLCAAWHYAEETGRIQRLLRLGADPNAKPNVGLSAYQAALVGRGWLLEKGSDIPLPFPCMEADIASSVHK